MISAVWRLQGVDCGGHDLVLSRLVPWAADGEVAVLSITSSFPPKPDGELASLLRSDSSSCTFLASDLQKPGFYIELVLSSAAELWGFRFEGPSLTTWPKRHQIGANGQTAALEMTPWQSVGLSAAPSIPASFERVVGVWQPATALGLVSWSWGVMNNAGSALFILSVNDYPRLTLDAGETWRSLGTAGITHRTCGAMSETAQVLLTAEYNGYIRLSKDFGLTWVTQTALGYRDWRSCAVSANGQVLLAGAYQSGYLYLSTDGGVTWVQQTAAGARNWFRCSMSGDGQRLFAAQQGGVAPPYLSIDGGLVWTPLNEAGARNWGCCTISSDGLTLLAGEYVSGYLHLSKDGGVSWAQQNSVGIGAWRGCSVSADGAVMLAVASGGFVYASTDGGETWEQQKTLGHANSWEVCAVSGDGQLFAVAGYEKPLRLYSPADPLYTMGQVVQSKAVPVTALDGSASLAEQGALPTAAPLVSALDVENGGACAIYGTVELYAQAGNIPLPRRVRLHRSRDGLLVRETWSDAQGNYRFDGISNRYTYDVIAWDHEGLQQSVVANDLTPEVMP